jgi:putative transcriptional regulator
MTMKAEAFDQLLKSVEQARDHALGKRELRTTVLPPAPLPITGAQVRRIRKRLNASQAVFARYLNVSAKLVQAWEAERRSPDGPALVLLRLGDREPEVLAAAAFGVPLREAAKHFALGKSGRRIHQARRGAGKIAKSA